MFKLENLFFLLFFLVFSCQTENKRQPTNAIEQKEEAQNLVVKSSDDVEVHYTQYSKGKEAIVFVHGWCCDQTYWKEQIDYFKKDFQVVSIDLGGHGLSSQGDRKEFTIPLFAKDVLKVVRSLTYEKVYLVGHSMGSVVVLTAASQLEANKTAVVCVDYLKNKLAAQPKAAVLEQLKPFEENYVASMKGMVGRMFNQNADETLKNWVLNDMSAGPKNVGMTSVIDMATRDYDSIFETIIAKNIPRYIINTDSRIMDEEHYKKLGFEIAIMPNTHHFLMMDNPRQFNEQLKAFIK